MAVLPDPDSPTIPSDSPCRRSKETCSTAYTTPVGKKKRLVRFSTESSMGLEPAASAGRSPLPADTVTGPLSGTCIAQCLITLVKKSQLMLKSSLTLLTFLR